MSEIANLHTYRRHVSRFQYINWQLFNALKSFNSGNLIQNNNKFWSPNMIVMQKTSNTTHFMKYIDSGDLKSTYIWWSVIFVAKFVRKINFRLYIYKCASLCSLISYSRSLINFDIDTIIFRSPLSRRIWSTTQW